MNSAQNSILVIDDDQSILDVIKLILEQENYHVVISDKSDVLTLIKKFQPNLVLIDNWLNGQDGLQSISQIHQLYKHLPVVMMSANPEIRIKAEAAGVNAFIDKPFDINDLTKTIASVLNN